jgi:hypothetical protein
MRRKIVASGFPAVEEAVINQCGDACNNSNVSNIENVPAEGAPMKMDEICNRAVQQTVQCVAKCPADQQAIACGDKGFGCILQEDDEDDGDDQTQCNEQDLHVGGEKTVGHAFVPGHGEVKEGRDLNGFAFIEIDDAEDPELRQLVDGEDEGGDEEAEADHERPPSPFGHFPNKLGKDSRRILPQLFGEVPRRGDGGLLLITPFSRTGSAIRARLPRHGG